MATMVGTQTNIFGIFVGFLLPSFFIDSYSSIEQLTEDTRPVYKQQLFYMLLCESIFATVIALLVVFTFRERPGFEIFGRGNNNNAEDEDALDRSMMSHESARNNSLS